MKRRMTIFDIPENASDSRLRTANGDENWTALQHFFHPSNFFLQQTMVSSELHTVQFDGILCSVDNCSTDYGYVLNKL